MNWIYFIIGIIVGVILFIIDMIIWSYIFKKGKKKMKNEDEISELFYLRRRVGELQYDRVERMY